MRMNRIDRVFHEARARGRKVLIPFITAGDPDLETTARLIPLIADAGGDIIELGIPFSDPMADGPTIQLSAERALKGGATLESILTTIKSSRDHTDVPLVLMGYYNPIFRYGVERFTQDAGAAGVDGLLVVDLPPEESRELARHCRRHGLRLIRLATPTTDRARFQRIAADAGGYIYYVSVTGVTGARNTLPEDLAARVKEMRSMVDIPVVIGFGIGTPELARMAAEAADGVVVGSALVRLFERHTGTSLDAEVSGFVRSMKQAVSP